MIETDPDMGLISGYRVFYADSKTPLQSPIFSAINNELPKFKDVGPSTTSVEITGLFPGKYQYFRASP